MFANTDQHLYIHVPYCAKKCPYCDFNSIAGRDHEHQDYVAALLKELDLYRGKRYRTIFIGGGTPSHLERSALNTLLHGIRTRIHLHEDYEWTCEVNPGSSDQTCFDLLQQHGVNRISMGVQSTHDHHLSFLGRIHDKKTAWEALNLAQSMFPRVSCDIIFGLPNQSTAELIADLQWYQQFNLQHASVYHLTIEPGTEFHGLYKRGIHKEIPQEDSWDLFRCVRDELQKLGLDSYETSNFCSEGQACQHNLAYWLQRDYDAVGAGAVSTYKGLRETRHKHPEQYIKAIHDDGQAIWQSEQLSIEDCIVEAWMLGLRLKRGVDLKHIRQLGDPDERWLEQAHTLQAQGYIDFNTEYVWIRDEARAMQDHITATLMPGS